LLSGFHLSLRINNLSQIQFQDKKYNMKKLFILLLIICSQSKAQLPVAVKPDASALLKQLVGGINPSSFISSFAGNKENWLSTVAKTASVPGLAKNIVSLGSFIKPSLFKEAFSLKNLEKTAATAKTMADASGLLKNLEGGLKPEAMTSDWASVRPGWTKALGLLK
jgi:hypothetical protein